jgi:molybdopterin molybdotransferase
MAALVPVTDALALIAGNSAPLGTQTLPIRDAIGHVLAQDVQARVTHPPLDASAMDGYAIKLAADHKAGSKFTLIGEAPAGRPFDGTVGDGETVRIFTGGAVPDGANHVIIQENVSSDGDIITLTEPPSPAAHIRKAGIDLKSGTTVLEKGTLLDPNACALLAAANHAQVEVYQKPVITLMANGDELVEPGSELEIGQIVSSNPYGLGPLLESWGAEAAYSHILPDDRDTIKTHVQANNKADILLPIGGASVGDHDHMRAVFDGLGYQPLFTKVAVKPGKPTWFGKLGAQYVLGLPGNPASAMVCAHIFLKPLIYALTGRSDPAHNILTARTTTALQANGNRAEYMRAHAIIDESGQFTVTPFPKQDSSLITPFTKTNCLLVRAVDAKAAKPGHPVHIFLIKPL